MMDDKKFVPKGEKLTDNEVLQAVAEAIQYIKNSYYGYGEITVIVSGRENKHVNLNIPYRGRQPKQVV